MKSALSIFNNSDPIQLVSVLGPAFARSKMFGCQNEQQGTVVALAVVMEGKSPFEISRKYHIIDGNLSKKSDAMLAEWRERGNDHEVVQRDPNGAEIKLIKKGIGPGGSDHFSVFRFTWEEAQEEPFPWSKKKNPDGSRQLKTNWSTPRARMQMLWARVVSDAVRTLCPEIVAGTYTPEEIADFENVVEGSVALDEQADAHGSGDAVDDSSSGSEVTGTPTENGFCTAEQRDLIASLISTLGIPYDAQEKILRKRGVSSIRSLTSEQADELYASLIAKQNEIDQSQVPDDVTEVQTDGPCTSEQIKQVKGLMGQMAEWQPDIAVKIKSMLAPREKLSELTVKEADQLAQTLQVKVNEHTIGGKEGN